MDGSSMKIGQVVRTKNGTDWEILSEPDGNGWLEAKRVLDGFITRVHITTFQNS